MVFNSFYVMGKSINARYRMNVEFVEGRCECIVDWCVLITGLSGGGKCGKFVVITK